MSFELSTLVVSALTLFPATTDPLDVSANEVASRLASRSIETLELPALAQDSAGAMQGDAAKAMKERELNSLNGSITAGAMVSFGNTEVKRTNVNAAADYLLDRQNRVSGTFDWFYGEEKDQNTKITRLTQRRTRGTLQYDRFFNDRLYGFARIDALGDALQNLKLRAVGSVGVGYQILQEENSSWMVEVGLAYVYTDIKNAAANALATGTTFDDPIGEVSGRVATKYWRQINEDLRYTFAAEWFPSLEDTDRHVVYASNQLDYKIGKGFTTSFRWELDYNSQPGFSASGNRLDRLDHRLIWGLGYAF